MAATDEPATSAPDDAAIGAAVDGKRAGARIERGAERRSVRRHRAQLSLPPLPCAASSAATGKHSIVGRRARPRHDSDNAALAANTAPAVQNSTTEGDADSNVRSIPPADVATANVTQSDPIEAPQPLGDASSTASPDAASPDAASAPPALLPPQRSEEADDATRIAAAQPDTRPDVDETDSLPAVPPELGTYLGGKTVLLRYDEENGAWFRVEPRSAVMAGERLLALPEFRPKITLASGVHLDMSGGTQVAMTPAMQSGRRTAGGRRECAGDRSGVWPHHPDQHIERRAASAAEAGSQRRRRAAARNATLAVEVERQYVPGNDPRKTPAPVMARLFAPDGGVSGRMRRAVDRR